MRILGQQLTKAALLLGLFWGATSSLSGAVDAGGAVPTQRTTLSSARVMGSAPCRWCRLPAIPIWSTLLAQALAPANPTNRPANGPLDATATRESERETVIRGGSLFRNLMFVSFVGGLALFIAVVAINIRTKPPAD